MLINDLRSMLGKSTDNAAETGSAAWCTRGSV